MVKMPQNLNVGIVKAFRYFYYFVKNKTLGIFI